MAYSQSKPATARVFYALWPSVELADCLGQIAEEVAISFSGRVTRRDTIHLTLAFLGNVPEARLPELVRAAAGVQGESFALTIDRLGFWAHNHLLWAGCAAPQAALTGLHERLSQALALADFRVGGAGRGFVPHVSLLRHVPVLPVGTKFPTLPTIEPLLWTCQRFVLVRSILSSLGSTYQVIEEFPLSGLS